MLVTGDPAGTLATRTAGLVEFRASLEWEGPPSRPPSCLPAPEPSLRQDLEEVLDPTGTKLLISGTIRAMTERELGAGLELVMRSVGNAAALSGAIVEMRAFRGCPPRATPPVVLQALALGLWRAGFHVRFAPSWTPAEFRGPSLGAGGEEEAVRNFLRDSPFWRPS